MAKKIITTLQVSQFRNLKNTTLNLAKQVNLFTGANGAGKTSLLESIYLLGHGRSFRCSRLQKTIQHNTTNWLITANTETLDGENDTSQQLGMSYDINLGKSIKLNQTPHTNISALAKALPMIYIGADSHFTMQSGPQARRLLINWGLFHVEHAFNKQWQQYQRILTQRNAALKARCSMDELSQWDIPLAEFGEAIQLKQQSYINALAPIAADLFAQLSGLTDIEISYKSGWSPESSLLTCLGEQHRKDQLLGYTQSGPHRADMQCLYQKRPCQDVLSQGQSKLLAYAIKLAQGIHLKQASGLSPIYLIDDMASELDDQKCIQVMQICCQSIAAQCIITMIEDHPWLDAFRELIQTYQITEGKTCPREKATISQ